MLLRDLFEITYGHVEIYESGDLLHPIYRGYYGFAPEELLNRKIVEISGSHYYPYMTNDETVDCLCIELAKE